MKAQHWKILASAGSVCAALLLDACDSSAQERAYQRASALEQKSPSTPDHAPAVIAEYQRVIGLEPGSSWAKKAQARIEAIKAEAKAEETRKSVFQEHGID